MSVFASGLVFDSENPIDVNFVVDNTRSADRTLLKIGTRAILQQQIFGSPQPVFSEWIIIGFAKDGRLKIKPLRDRQYTEIKLVTSGKFLETFKIQECRINNQTSG